MRGLIIVLVSTFLIGLGWVTFRHVAESRGNKSTGVLVVDGTSQSSSKRGLDHVTVSNNDMAIDEKTKPASFSTLREQILKEDLDATWSLSAQVQLRQTASLAAGLSDFQANCRATACLMTGSFASRSDNQLSPVQIGSLIDSSPMLKSINPSGDRYIRYKLKSLNPTTISFEAIGFRR